MANKTQIEWTDATWNSIVGCAIVSPGCTNCYAMRMAARLERMLPAGHYAGTTQASKAGPVWTGDVAQAPHHILTQPLRWKRPRQIFVNSMSDLFHESVPDEWIDRIFAVMALCPQHTFQVLTKRPVRMQAYIDFPRRRHQIARSLVDMFTAGMLPKMVVAYAINNDRWPVESEGDIDFPDDIYLGAWPLPNVWLGVSVEDQKRADERIPLLLDTPAAIRFVSAEPMLGPIDLEAIKVHASGEPLDWFHFLNALTGEIWDDDGPVCGAFEPGTAPKLDWVIVGGESGKDARPMHPDWARSIRDQCTKAQVPFFFKQQGEWSAVYDRDQDDPDWRQCPTPQNNKERYVNLKGGHGFHGERVVFMRRIGKKAAGRILDGVSHDGFPEMKHE